MGGLSKHHMLNIAMQMIEAIESFHSCGYVHRDIKPENFAIGIKGDNHTIYLLDFGLSKKYLLDNGEHIPFVEGKNLVGTARFASRNCHKGID
jgi:serine/threonine protein kinase